jgi:hypothetical protein
MRLEALAIDLKPQTRCEDIRRKEENDAQDADFDRDGCGADDGKYRR